MMRMDARFLLDDFEAEARAHIGEIEAAFLAVDALANDHKLIDGIFRNAHSLKGTAGFFALDKIVAVAHELESVFSQIKAGNLVVNEEIADVVLQSVDCLKDLVDHIGDDDGINIKALLKALKKHARHPKTPNGHAADPVGMPSGFTGHVFGKALQNAMRRGHSVYYITIGFGRGLESDCGPPGALIGNILSIGAIAGAIVNGNADKPIHNSDGALLTAEIMSALGERGPSTLEFLATSVLEPDLFATAIDMDPAHVRLLPKEVIVPQIAAEEHDQAGLPAIIPAMEDEQIYWKASARKSNFSIRLDISAINGLLDLTNEMILTRNQLLSIVSGYKKSIAGLTPILHDMNRLTSEIQEKVMLTRMQPLSTIFCNFPRIIRDTAKMLHKEIEIQIHGDDVMLDKYLLDSLTDPITQLVRNAADHGLEPPERRVALGKHKSGKITLNAYMHDGSAIVEVKDDGAGIDVEGLKRKALELGIATEEALVAMPQNEVFALMFEPGISTAKRITSVSGRGVGMDIVKTNIEGLGGSIEIDSQSGKGTTVRLKMPLTLSVIRTLIVTIDSVPYAVPETNVERIVRIWRATPSRRLEGVNNALVLTLDGQVIPVVTMEEMDAKARGLEPPPAEALLERAKRREVIKCLVLKVEGKDFALLIDDAIETVETLVKPLPIYLQTCLCYSNVTVLGNGNAVAILDAEGILRLMGIEAVEMGAPTGPVQRDAGDQKQVILFQCSGAEYFALEAGEIARIEVIRPEQIQEIGAGRFVNIAGETVRLVRPEDYAPVQKHGYTGEKLYVLTLKKSESPIGLLAGKVLDKIEHAFALDHDRICSDCLFGTSVLDEKVLLFLNPAAIMAEVEKGKKRKSAKNYGKVV